MDNNLNLYYVFYSVARCKSISGAAKELYISQPAISKTISKLEQNLNTRLFIRNSRGVSLTLEGEMLYEQVKAAFECIRTGEEKIKLAGELGIGHLSIGVSATLCKYVLLPYLKEFIKQYPHIRIQVFCQSSTETIEKLQNRSIDIGLIGFPEEKSTLLYHPLMEIHDIFVTTDHYLKNLRQRGILTTESIFSDAVFMMLNKENITRKYVDAHLIETKTTMENIIEVNNMDLLIEFAKIDLGIACVIKEFVLSELEEENFMELSLLSPVPSRKIGFAYTSQTHRDNPALSVFLENCPFPFI